MAKMAEGFKTRLAPEDEYPHDPGEAKNYNESMYFNVFDPAKKTGGWFRIGNRPNERSVSLSLSGQYLIKAFAFNGISNHVGIEGAGLDAGR